jgi:tRNA uridine 5-carbamoylmethylation protein Kti12
MKLILLYGPPAVGKLTIAKEIARLTGFQVFHAHLTVDLVASIFPRGTPSYRKLLWDIRYAVFAEAVRANIDGLIFTMVYRRDQEQFIARCVEIVEWFGGKVCFVHVYCHAETLRQRVVREDRKQHGKITSVELLNQTLSNWESQSPFEAATQWDSLGLNTDVLRPVEAAQQVMAHYRLPSKHHNLTTQWRCDPFP